MKYIKLHCGEQWKAMYDEFWTSSRLEQALMFQDNRNIGYDESTVVIREDFLGVYLTFYSVGMGIHGFFPRRKSTCLFRYDLTKRRGQIASDRSSVHTILQEHPEWEFLKSLTWTQCMSMTVVRDILLGKLTSVDSVIRAYFKSLGVKGYSGKELRRLTAIAPLVEVLAVFDIDKLIPALRDEEQKRILSYQGDIIQQAYWLGIKLNPRWSEKRFHEEHQRLTQILMQGKLEKMGNTPVWDLPEEFNEVLGIPCQVRLLNTERAVYEEGTLMHHCLYTNYWRRIKDRRYIAFSIILPSGERATLGIAKSTGGWWFDQCYRKYDMPVEGYDETYVRRLAEGIYRYMYSLEP